MYRYSILIALVFGLVACAYESPGEKTKREADEQTDRLIQEMEAEALIEDSIEAELVDTIPE